MIKVPFGRPDISKIEINAIKGIKKSYINSWAIVT